MAGFFGEALLRGRPGTEEAETIHRQLLGWIPRR
jgi:hypothetical protein